MRKLLYIVAAAALIIFTSCSSSNIKAIETTEKPSALLEYTETETETETPSAAAENKNIKEYILNIRSGKIHFPDCYSVDLMAEHNKEYITADITELINRGFTPCQNCNPY